MSDKLFLVFGGCTIILAFELLLANIISSFNYTYELKNEKIFSYIQETLNSKLIYEFNPRIKCLYSEEISFRNLGWKNQ